VDVLTDEAPVYDRPMSPARELPATDPLETIPEETDLGESLLKLMGGMSQGQKTPIWRQYDYMVRTNTLAGPGGDAALVRIKGTKKSLALTTDGNARYCMLDAHTGGALAVAEAARNISCTGATPLAMTNCLNFGNPENPAVMAQFSSAVEGMSEACRALGVPVVSGNVSFYNETHGEDIYPTPIVGMVGLIEDSQKRATQGFVREGDDIALLHPAAELPLSKGGAHEYVWVLSGREGGAAPAISLESEAFVQDLCRKAIASGLLGSAHDLSDGGLGVALAECALSSRGGGLGANIRLPECGGRLDGIFFGEVASRILVSASPDAFVQLRKMAESHEVGCYQIGQVAAGSLRVEAPDGAIAMELELDNLMAAWSGALGELL
ncbi:MAG: phosphoribosylformylglycinamidine synthase II, partial [Nitrospinaceae bacterium]|nr:phosphoribosylformylglycinamidine synthase II [Nitrospinaceae bacterium]